MSLNFTVEAKEFEPDIFLEALLRITLTPTDTDVEGSAIAESSLKMSRMFSTGDYKLIPGDNSNIYKRHNLVSYSWFGRRRSCRVHDRIV